MPSSSFILLAGLCVGMIMTSAALLYLSQQRRHESFTMDLPGDAVWIRASYNVGGQLADVQHFCKTFVVHDRTINNMELRTGDRVELVAQDAPAENGNYIVFDVCAEDGFYYLGSCKVMAMDAYPHYRVSNTLYIDMPAQDNHGILPGDLVYFSDKLLVAKAEEYVQGGLYSFQLMSLGDKRCSNPVYVFEEDCARHGHVWDKPCVSSSECPFYENRKPYRGGCMGSGLCEMPAGVERTGFTKFKRS